MSMRGNRGNTGILVLGLIGALIVVLAIPLLIDVGDYTEANLGDLFTEMGGDLQAGIN